MSPVPRRSRSPELPWWTAWLWRQFAKGWKTSSPVNLPTHRFARLLGRKEPWAQSWKTMNVRSRKPAAGISEREGDPDRDVEAEVHRHGYSQVGHHRGGQIEQAVRQRGSLVTSNGLAPIETIGPRVGINRLGGSCGRCAHDGATISVPPKAHHCRKGTSVSHAEWGPCCYAQRVPKTLKVEILEFEDGDR